MNVSILSNRRRIPPYGLAGGESGALGYNSILRTQGTEETLDAKANAQLEAGDILLIKTPGGGGFGQA